MFSSKMNIRQLLGDFHVEGTMMRYSVFVPRLYNMCKSLGFTPGKIVPSRAFCSDESQGYPIILLTKHFGTFPFNHGRVGSIVATDRHGPHAEHGQDMMILQASHVGYEPESETFGVYRRLQTACNEHSPNCGKIDHVLSWYQQEYQFARKNIFISRHDGEVLLIIDNQLLKAERDNGLFLNLEKMVRLENGQPTDPIRSLSTAKCYHAGESIERLSQSLGIAEGEHVAIGNHLAADLFRFKRGVLEEQEGYDQLEHNLLDPMSWIVTSPHPMLTAAQVNTQVEFDRTYRSLVKAEGYKGKKLVFLAGLNIDISPKPGQLFPLTKFVPWAAYVQDGVNEPYLLEQAELIERLRAQSTDNADEIDMEAAIEKMEKTHEVKVYVAGEHQQGD